MMEGGNVLNVPMRCLVVGPADPTMLFVIAA